MGSSLLALLEKPCILTSNVLNIFIEDKKIFKDMFIEFCKGKYDKEILNTMRPSDQELLMNISAIMLKYYQHNLNAHDSVFEIKAITK